MREAPRATHCFSGVVSEVELEAQKECVEQAIVVVEEAVFSVQDGSVPVAGDTL